MKRRPIASSRVAFALAIFFAGLVAFAQYQVNRQIYGSPGPSASSVRYAPQYLGGTAYAPSSARLLPSEVRNSYVRSGELPSSIKMGYNSVGPLSPTGAISYIPPPPSHIPRGAPPGPQGNMVNPQVNANLTRTSPYAVNTPGSIRYAGTTPAVGAAPSPFQPTAPAGGYAQPMNPTAYSGSVSYVPGTSTPSGNPFNSSVKYSR